MRDLLTERTADLVADIAASRVLLAFDFDGTLAPIVDDPDGAHMRPATSRLFRELCGLYPCVVISGRAKADVLARLDGAAVRHVVGNHGLEAGGGLDTYAEETQIARRLLEAALGGARGLEIEDKRYSLAIHYRRAPGKRAARALITRAIAALPSSMRVVEGKQVVNLVPERAPHKGDALLRLRALEQADTAIFVGDDVTDEDVFTLDEPGRLLTVRIGKSARSAAAYYLRDQRTIDKLLSRLVSLRKGGKARPAELGEPPGDGDALEFLRRVWALNHALELLSGSMATRLGVTAQQRLVIRFLGKYPGLPAGRLAALLHVDPGTISAALGRLEAKGLVLRRRDPRDRRRAALQLTAKGRRLDRAAPGTVESAVEALLHTTATSDVEAAVRVLEQLTERLRAERPG